LVRNVLKLTWVMIHFGGENKFQIDGWLAGWLPD
jgi:hypothetical protein